MPALCAKQNQLVTAPTVGDACEADDEERLRFGPGDALERLEDRGDLFEPALTLAQELPAG